MSTEYEGERSLSSLIDEIRQLPEYNMEAEKCRDRIKSLIKDIVPEGCEREYRIKILDHDLTNVQVVTMNDDGSDGEVLIDGFYADYYPLSIINEEMIPIDFLGENVEISIEKIPDIDSEC